MIETENYKSIAEFLEATPEIFKVRIDFGIKEIYVSCQRRRSKQVTFNSSTSSLNVDSQEFVPTSATASPVSSNSPLPFAFPPPSMAVPPPPVPKRLLTPAKLNLNFKEPSKSRTGESDGSSTEKNFGHKPNTSNEIVKHFDEIGSQLELSMERVYIGFESKVGFKSPTPVLFKNLPDLQSYNETLYRIVMMNSEQIQLYNLRESIY